MNKINTQDVGYAARELVKRLFAEEIHTCQPGMVQAYTGGTSPTADVLPLLRAAQPDGTQQALAMLPAVPVLVLGTATCGIKFDLVQGDIGLLIFAEKSPGLFLQTGQVADTLLEQNFSQGNAFFIPLFGSQFGTAGSGDITIYNNGTGKIILGGASAQTLATEKFVKNWFLGHVHATAATGTPSPPMTAAAVPMTEALIIADNGLTSKTEAQ
jgi:hypothetical protein